MFQLVNNKIVADGDTQEHTGLTTHKYVKITIDGSSSIGREATGWSTWDNVYYIALSAPSAAYTIKIIANNYITIGYAALRAATEAGLIGSTKGGSTTYLEWTSNNATLEEEKAYLTNHPIEVVYLLATPTTETLTGFTSPQAVGSTESYTDNRDFPVPVGHESRYANIYPITGHDTLNSYVTGVNVWDEEWENGGFNTSTGAKVVSAGEIRNINNIPVIEGTVYYAVKPYISQITMIFFDADGNVVPYVTTGATATKVDNSAVIAGQNAGGTVKTPSGATTMMFKVNTTTYNNDISINYPSTDHDYHAYIGTTYETDLEQTVYGGDADVVGGTGTSNLNSVDLSTLTWQLRSTGANHKAWSSNLPAPYKPTDVRYEILGWLSDRYAERGPETGSNIVSQGADAFDIGLWSYMTSVASTTVIYCVTDISDEPAGQLVYELATPTDLTFTPQTVSLNSGTNNVWSDAGDVTVKVADAVESGYYLTEMPLSVTVTGAGTAGRTLLAIKRAEDYFLERPDEDESGGFEGDTIIQISQDGEDQILIERDALIGKFDDGATYRIIATITDNLGQVAEAEKLFTVRWAHQAVMATGTAVIENDIGIIRPTMPSGALESDHVDIYRLSTDKPELLYENAVFGETYVDPHPTIGEFGGYRLVLVTANGDYITEQDTPSWIDIPAGLETLFQFIDFDGRHLIIKYNVDLDSSYQKQFTVTRYLGGRVEGHWEQGVIKNGGIKGAVPLDLDPETYEQINRLGRYLGRCRVRTKAGANYVADIQVSENSTYNSPAHPHSITLTITKVDNVTPDGLTLADWENQ